MNDKDRTGETHGAADALDPLRPGGEPKSTGETDQRPDPANEVPTGEGGSAEQTGDRSERAAELGGPVGTRERTPR